MIRPLKLTILSKKSCKKECDNNNNDLPFEVLKTLSDFKLGLAYIFKRSIS